MTPKRLLARLADHAVNQGVLMGDQRSWARRRGQLHTDPFWKPGAFIERLSSEEREMLQNLTSADAENTQTYSEDWDHREGHPQLRVEGHLANGTSLKLSATNHRISSSKKLAT